MKKSSIAILLVVIYSCSSSYSENDSDVEIGNTDIDSSCWDLQRIAACVAATLGVQVILDAFSGVGCITKAIAWSTLKMLARYTLGAAAVVVFIAEFSVCMGWI